MPHLKIISAAQNRGSGGVYGRMVSPTTGCAMDARRNSTAHGGGHFLVLALSGPSPTSYLCNGPNP